MKTKLVLHEISTLVILLSLGIDHVFVFGFGFFFYQHFFFSTTSTYGKLLMLTSNSKNRGKKQYFLNFKFITILTNSCFIFKCKMHKLLVLTVFQNKRTEKNIIKNKSTGT